MQARKKNMERMAEVVPESDEQVLQHFLSNSAWDERGVLDQVALEADGLLGGTDESALLIDESGITKKGSKSVGVARQWNGRLGKVDNCQVGVYAALSRGSLSTLIDTAHSTQDDHRFRCEGDRPFHGKTATCRSEATRAFALLLDGGGGRQFGVTFSRGIGGRLRPEYALMP